MDSEQVWTVPMQTANAIILTFCHNLCHVSAPAIFLNLWRKFKVCVKSPKKWVKISVKFSCLWRKSVLHFINWRNLFRRFFPGSKLENLFDELSRTNDALRKLKGIKFERFDSLKLDEKWAQNSFTFRIWLTWENWIHFV